MFALLLRFFTQIDFRADDSLVLDIHWSSPSPRCSPATCWPCSRTTSSASWPTRRSRTSAICWWRSSRAADLAVTAVTFYLIAYFVASTAPSASSPSLSGPERDADRIDDYRGLFWTRPWLAAVLTAMLLSLAGIPLTAGFVGKFYLVAAGAQPSLWALIIILVATSVIGLFYYLRIIVAMYTRPEAEEEPLVVPRLPSPAETVVLVMVAGLALWLGVYPSPLLHIIPGLPQ